MSGPALPPAVACCSAWRGRCRAAGGERGRSPPLRRPRGDRRPEPGDVRPSIDVGVVVDRPDPHAPRPRAAEVVQPACDVPLDALLVEHVEATTRLRRRVQVSNDTEAGGTAHPRAASCGRRAQVGERPHREAEHVAGTPSGTGPRGRRSCRPGSAGPTSGDRRSEERAEDDLGCGAPPRGPGLRSRGRTDAGGEPEQAVDGRRCVREPASARRNGPSHRSQSGAVDELDAAEIERKPAAGAARLGDCTLQPWAGR
jgi:hypothetical protein